MNTYCGGEGTRTEPEESHDQQHRQRDTCDARKGLRHAHCLLGGDGGVILDGNGNSMGYGMGSPFETGA